MMNAILIGMVLVANCLLSAIVIDEIMEIVA